MEGGVRFVHYLEVKRLEPAVDALGFLRAQRATLEGRAGCLRALILHNATQPEVYLLESHWSETPPTLEGLEAQGLRVSQWTFGVLEG